MSWKKTLAQHKFMMIFQNPGATFGLAVVIIVTLAAILAPALTSYDPRQPNLAIALQPPSPGHLFGTDHVGRDILTRVLYGARISLMIGLGVQLIAITLGTVLGLISGYFGGLVDDLVMGLNNIFFAFPGLLLALGIMAALGTNIVNLFIALGLVGWPQVCRLIRAEVMSLREREFVTAAKAQGLSVSWILLRHILPNCLGPLIVLATLGVAGAIISEAALSFLGMGVQPPHPSWGSMIAMGRNYIYSSPWIIMFPGLAIFVTILGLNMLGDGLRDITDPRIVKK